MYTKSQNSYVPTRFGVYWQHLQGAPCNCKLFAAHQMIVSTCWPLGTMS